MITYPSGALDTSFTMDSTVANFTKIHGLKYLFDAFLIVINRFIPYLSNLLICYFSENTKVRYRFMSKKKFHFDFLHNLYFTTIIYHWLHSLCDDNFYMPLRKGSFSLFLAILVMIIFEDLAKKTLAIWHDSQVFFCDSQKKKLKITFPPLKSAKKKLGYHKKKLGYHFFFAKNCPILA